MVNQKKGIVFVCISMIFFVLILANVSSLSIEVKENFQKQETGIAKVIGASSLAESQVSFYRGNSEIALERGLVKIGDFYYIWFVSPNSESNYSIELNDVSTLDGLQKVSKNFSVSNETSEYYIKPGAVIASKDFSIDIVSNVDADQTISISYPVARSISIESGSNNVEFSFNEAKTRITAIEIGKYSLPAYFVVAGSSGTSDSNETNISSSNLTQGILLDVSPKKIERIENEKDEHVYSLTIFNYGTKNASDVVIEYNKKVFKLSQDILDLIPSNGSVGINLSIIALGNISEVIFVKKDNYSIAIPIQIERIVNNSNVSTVNVTSSGFYDCILELQGQQCLPDQKCTKNTTISRQGSCCLGSCYYPDKGGSSSWIGWLIALVVLGVIGYFIWKYKQAAPIENPIEKQVKEIEKKENEKKSLIPDSAKK